MDPDLASARAAEGSTDRAGTGRTTEKRVTWAELFLDLVFVFAITQVSALLHGDTSWAGLGRALLVFVPIYWSWVSTSVYANTRDVDNAVDRLGILVVALASLFMALAVPGAFGERTALFAVAYLAVRVALLILVLRSRGLFFNPFTAAVFITGPLRLVGALVGPAAQLVLWSAAAAVDIAAPAIARRRVQQVVRFDPVHLPERFGLFVIIALGESIIAIGASAAADNTLPLAAGVTVATAFTLVAGLWWMYFGFAVEAVRRALEVSRARADTVRQVLTYAHFGLIGGVICVAVGIAEAVVAPQHHLHTGAAALLFGGSAGYLASLAAADRRMARGWSAPRLAGTVVLLALLPAAGRVPALAALAVLTAIILAVDLAELLRSRRPR